MKVLSSLKSAKARHRDCKVVRRRGKVFVICKSNPRFKARQRKEARQPRANRKAAARRPFLWPVVWFAWTGSPKRDGGALPPLHALCVQSCPYQTVFIHRGGSP